MTFLTAPCDVPLLRLCCSHPGGPVYLNRLSSRYQSLLGAVDIGGERGGLASPLLTCVVVAAPPSRAGLAREGLRHLLGSEGFRGSETEWDLIQM